MSATFIESTLAQRDTREDCFYWFTATLTTEQTLHISPTANSMVITTLHSGSIIRVYLPLLQHSFARAMWIDEQTLRMFAGYLCLYDSETRFITDIHV